MAIAIDFLTLGDRGVKQMNVTVKQQIIQGKDLLRKSFLKLQKQKPCYARLLLLEF
ncbi:hypothetical protein [Pseudanabaena sp. UWO310]|uniref:hypothetical protein n=1 Tax=Pseudanabaena sp. UWO310 TaxID=2480795 RepID=UPI0016806337|nr:hypothetical protein [Pseudanabaena sp. UWO310]